MLDAGLDHAQIPLARFQLAPLSEQDGEWLYLDGQIPADHVARQIIERLNSLDLTLLRQSYQGRGSPAIRPDLLLRISLLEIRDGHCKPSEWHRNCRESLVLKWAGLGIQPSRATWYNFAERVGPLLESLVRQTIQQAREEEVTTATEGALDGTFFAAHASRHRLVNETVVKQRREALQQACALDAQGETPETPRWMANVPTTRRAQLQRYVRCQARLQELQEVNDRQCTTRRRATDKVVISPTDPDAAVGRDKEKVYRPLYNVQLVRDVKSTLILGYDMFAQNHDHGTLKPTLNRLRTGFHVKLRKLNVDAAYTTGNNLAFCGQQNVELFGPLIDHDFDPQPAAANTQRTKPRPVQISKQHFEFLPEENAYRCPQGFRLIQIGVEQRMQAGGEVTRVHRYRCSPQHCGKCPQAATCTSSPQRGRSLRRSEHEPLIEEHRKKMATDEAKAYMRCRGQTVETTFGDAKQNRSLRMLSLRGIVRAVTQIGLFVLVSNVRCLIKAAQRAEPPCESPCAEPPES